MQFLKQLTANYLPFFVQQKPGPIEYACNFSLLFEAGKFDDAKKLIESFGYPNTDCGEFISQLSSTGKFEAIKWLFDNYGPPKIDYANLINHLCVNGHTNTIKWLFDSVEIDCTNLINHLCANGHVGTIKWLFDGVKIALPKANIACADSIIYSHKNGEFDTRDAMIKIFSQLNIDCSELISHLYKTGNLEILEMVIKSLVSNNNVRSFNRANISMLEFYGIDTTELNKMLNDKGLQQTATLDLDKNGASINDTINRSPSESSEY